MTHDINDTNNNNDDAGDDGFDTTSYKGTSDAQSVARVGVRVQPKKVDIGAHVKRGVVMKVCEPRKLYSQQPNPIHIESVFILYVTHLIENRSITWS
jgi:hypothetical protein